MTAQPDQAAFTCADTSLDDITVFLGTLSPEEYEQRRKIRACRNAASFMATQTPSDTARALCWMICDTATAWIYSPAPLPRLENVAQFLRRLLIVANQAQDLEAVQ